MEMPIFLSYLLVFYGILVIYAAMANWQWYFKQRRASRLVKRLGLINARVVYGLLGLFFLLVGLNELLGWGIFKR